MGITLHIIIILTYFYIIIIQPYFIYSYFFYRVSNEAIIVSMCLNTYSKNKFSGLRNKKFLFMLLFIYYFLNL